MATTSSKIIHADDAPIPDRRKTLYDTWAESLGIPIHTGFYVEDVRTLSVGWWEERQCNAAIVKLVGQEGVTEAKVLEIPPGGTTAPAMMTIDEIVYVADGRGLATLWAEGMPKKTVEWSDHSFFMVPRNHYYQLSNVQGNRPARLLHYSYLRLLMPVAGDPDLFFKSSHVDLSLLYPDGASGGYYSEAKNVSDVEIGDFTGRMVWSGNFFPDMQSWDKVSPQQYRGGGKNVMFRFANSHMTSHMAVFPARSYKKAHRHGAGFLIVIPKGTGYSLMWPREGADKIIIPWHEGSVFVPPHRWWHQHFNTSNEGAGRYLAFHPPRGLPGVGEALEDLVNDQIEYPDEEPIIRELFEQQLGERGLTSIMPEDAYRDKNYEFTL
jgi:hypothetical protein